MAKVFKNLVVAASYLQVASAAPASKQGKVSFNPLDLIFNPQGSDILNCCPVYRTQAEPPKTTTTKIAPVSQNCSCLKKANKSFLIEDSMTVEGDRETGPIEENDCQLVSVAANPEAEEAFQELLEKRKGLRDLIRDENHDQKTTKQINELPQEDADKYLDVQDKVEEMKEEIRQQEAKCKELGVQNAKKTGNAVTGKFLRSNQGVFNFGEEQPTATVQKVSSEIPRWIRLSLKLILGALGICVFVSMAVLLGLGCTAAAEGDYNEISLWILLLLGPVSYCFNMYYNWNTLSPFLDHKELLQMSDTERMWRDLACAHFVFSALLLIPILFIFFWVTFTRAEFEERDAERAEMQKRVDVNDRI